MKEITYTNTIKTAERLFNRFGIAKTAMDDIARAAEVSRATIFNNFGNKDGLLKAVLDNKIKELNQAIRLKTEITKSSSGRLKSVLIERIRMLSGLKFISDQDVSTKNRIIDHFMDDLNRVSMRMTLSILKIEARESDDVKRLSNTIFFMLKGIEQAITRKEDRLTMKQIEKDLDFFLKAMLPEPTAKMDCD